MSVIRNWVGKFSLLAVALVAVVVFNGNAIAGGGPPDAPEIDPSSILSAVTLLSGGMLILNDRRRRSK